jgi:hypothetical protein
MSVLIPGRKAITAFNRGQDELSSRTIAYVIVCVNSLKAVLDFLHVRADAPLQDFPLTQKNKRGPELHLERPAERFSRAILDFDMPNSRELLQQGGDVRTVALADAAFGGAELQQHWSGKVF